MQFLLFLLLSLPRTREKIPSPEGWVRVLTSPTAEASGSCHLGCTTTYPVWDRLPTDSPNLTSKQVLRGSWFCCCAPNERALKKAISFLLSTMEHQNLNSKFSLVLRGLPFALGFLSKLCTTPQTLITVSQALTSFYKKPFCVIKIQKCLTD